MRFVIPISLIVLLIIAVLAFYKLGYKGKAVSLPTPIPAAQNAIPISGDPSDAASAIISAAEDENSTMEVEEKDANIEDSQEVKAVLEAYSENEL